MKDFRVLESGFFTAGLILGVFFIFQLFPLMLPLSITNIYIHLVIFYFIFLTVFLFDYDYFLLRVDYSKTPLEFMINMVILILVLAIPRVIENITNPLPSMFILIVLLFTFSINKYNIALKREIKDKRGLCYAREKRRLDTLALTSIALFTIITFITPKYNIILIDLMILEIGGFAIYASIKPSYFLR